MSRCAPVAGKPICLEFMPEAAVGDILVAQVSWKAIPDTRPRDSETSVTECVVCAWSVGELSYRGNVRLPTWRDEHYGDNDQPADDDDDEQRDGDSAPVLVVALAAHELL